MNEQATVTPGEWCNSANGDGSADIIVSGNVIVHSRLLRATMYGAEDTATVDFLVAMANAGERLAAHLGVPELELAEKLADGGLVELVERATLVLANDLFRRGLDKSAEHPTFGMAKLDAALAALAAAIATDRGQEMSEPANRDDTIGDATEAAAIAFEQKHGPVAFLRVACTSICRALINKGLVTSAELQAELRAEIKRREQP